MDGLSQKQISLSIYLWTPSVIYNFNEYQTKLASKKYDICICGAGAAGIILAKKLSEKGKAVALLEGGDREYSQESQDIYQGESVGLEYYPELWRLRYLGGTTNHWSGRCRPFVKEDFDNRALNGMPGWPISFSEINSYLLESKKILELSPIEDSFSPLAGTKILSDKFIPDTFNSSNPVRFGQKYYNELSESKNIDLFLNANVTNILLASDLTTIDSIAVRTIGGKEDKILAEKFVLSMGAIENARLLLCSDSQIPEGLGNKNDMVGRCFMEHFNIDMGEFIADPKSWGENTEMQFFTRPEYSSKNKLAMSNITFGTVSQIKAYGRTAELKKIFNELVCDLGLSSQLQFIYDHNCVGEGVISTLYEQFPNLESRVTLGENIDSLGLKNIVLDWKMSGQDEESIRTIAIAMAKEFARNNLGRVKLKSYILNKNEKIPTGAHAHQMGTTRMAASSEHGVVDINCRVFETNNLYIAGSSVFSTGGGGNPTMPLIQLALRLADHLL